MDRKQMVGNGAQLVRAHLCRPAFMTQKLVFMGLRGPLEPRLALCVSAATLTSQVTATINSRRSDELSYEKHKLCIIRSSY